ncbi:MAG: RHS repeat domain-containing protein, partial [Thermodesulfovibrionales bacterium]|nr:RHS repeat domain-containing protein [Thermodesulfovibrionales bacterium]
MRKIVAYLLVLCLLLLIPSFSFASDANYIYDDVGRLIKVIPDTGDVATYNYDAVGNLISITTQTISQSPPVLYSINPDIV